MPKKDFEIKTTFRGVDKLSRVVGRMQTRIARFSSVSSRALKKVDRVMSSVTRVMTKGLKYGAVATAAGIGLLTTAAWKLVGAFSKIEDAEAAFTPVLGGAARAKDMVAALNKTAATTPFQFETLSSAAKQLLPNMGGDIEKTIERIRMLGDTAGGNAQKMDSIVRGYNKALLKGKVDMESLNMIAEAGVPIFNTLGEVMNLNQEKMFKTISKGKVQTSVLTAALQKMTSEGGIFFKGMEIASQTLTGKISTLKDNVGLTAAEFGSVLAPVLKDVVDELTGVAGRAREWVIANKDLIKSRFQEIVAKIPPILERLGHYAKIAWGYIKLLPEYFDDIAYWAPKVAKFIGIFYAVTGAVKVANVAMTVFNTLISIDIGPMKKLSKEMGTNVPSATGKANKALMAFHGVLGLITAAVAGWEIGKLIYEQLTKHLIEAHRVADEINKIGTAHLSDQDLNYKRSVVQKALEQEKASWFTNDQEVRTLQAELRIIDKSLEVNRQKRALQELKAPMPAPSPAPIRPSVQISESSSVNINREETEVTLRDETGRARVTRGGRGRGFKLVHSGGMP